MAKRMSDDEVMEEVYNQLFGDLDRLESHALFDEKEPELKETENAMPESKESGGIKVTIEPLMASTAESSRMSSGDDEDEEDDEDKLKGIGGMSPLMAQLHGER